jgi:predicted dehydrogenase
MSRRPNRRDFLKQSTVAGFGFWVAGGVSLADSSSPNEKPNIACIGVGGKGAGDSSQAGQYGNIVAICDIDDQRLEKKAGEFSQAKKYYDYRKMFDEMGKSIDAVTVSTPDHSHAAASIMAIRLGKHVYCQKPLTHTVYEARMMRELAKQYKVATQMGNQGSASNGLRRAVELVQDGLIGTVREAHVWTNRPVWPQAPKVTKRPAEAPVPQYVHWDEFIGPAPMRPFAVYDDSVAARRGARGAYHPFNWRGWWDFGTGALGDMACHTCNLPFRAMKLYEAHATSIVAESGELNPETYPAWAIVHYEFPARGSLPAAKLTWYEGHRSGQTVVPPGELLKGSYKSAEGATTVAYKEGKFHFNDKVVTSGSFMIGDKGILFAPDDNGTTSYVLKDGGIQHVSGDPERLPRNGGGDSGMKKEWLAAAKGGPPAFSNFDFAGRLTETILLGNVAVCVGKKLDWDGPNLKAVNCPEADQYLRMEYRKGWTL